MDEQLIRQQTAVLLDAYRELTGSKEIPGIEDFLNSERQQFAKAECRLEEIQIQLSSKNQP